MKIKTNCILSLLAGSLIACSTMSVIAQTSDKIPANELKRELELFERYLNSANTQLGIASNRFWESKSCDAIADPLISALANKDISAFKQEGFTERNRRNDGMAMTRRRYDERYQGIQVQTGVAEDLIDQLVVRFTKSCPDWSNFFTIYRRAAKALRGDANVEKKIKDLVDSAKQAMAEGKGAQGAADAVRKASGGGKDSTGPSMPQGWSSKYVTDGGYRKLFGSDGNLLDGVTIDSNGVIHFADGSTFNPATGEFIDKDGVKHAGGVLKDDGNIYFPDGSVYNPRTGQWYNPKTKEWSSNPPAAQGTQGAGAGDRNTTTTSSDVNQGGPKNSGSGLAAREGEEIDEINFEQDGKKVQGKKIARYVGKKGTKLVHEEIVLDGAANKEVFDYAFAIAADDSDPEKSGDVYKKSFELVNDRKGGGAFSVKAWEGPTGKVETSDKKVTLSFPKPGNYTIKVEGETKYKSKFVITQTVDF